MEVVCNLSHLGYDSVMLIRHMNYDVIKKWQSGISKK